MFRGIQLRTARVQAFRTRGLRWVGMAFCAAAGVTTAASAGGCGYQYKADQQTVSQVFERGDYTQAAVAAEHAAKHGAAQNKLSYTLEVGSTARVAGQYGQSNGALQKADNLFDTYDERAKVRPDRELAAVLINPMAVEYEGRGYERIMLNCYRALNFLEQGQTDDARIAIKRTEYAQQRNEDRYEDAIAKDQKLRDNNRADSQSAVDEKGVTQDPNFQKNKGKFLADFQDEVAADGPLPDQKHKQLWDNPFAEYLQAVFYLNSSNGGDHEVGRVAMRNAAGMTNNPYVKADAAYAEQVASGSNPGPRVYVLFETGMAPYFQEIRIDLPVLLLNLRYRKNSLSYVGVAFPVLKKSRGARDFVVAGTTSGTYKTAMLADLDRIVAREFKEELPSLITRTIISTIAKAAINVGVNEAAKSSKNEFVQIGALIGTAVAQAVLNEADVRCWRTLPKQVQVASFATPVNGRVDLSLENGAPFGSVNVSTNQSSIIWVRSASNSAGTLVRVIPMNPSKAPKPPAEDPVAEAK